MVAKKKGVCLGLLLPLLGIGNLTANNGYRLLLVNNTAYEIEFAVDYHGSCTRDIKRVHHRRIEKLWSNKQCSIRKISTMILDEEKVPLKNDTRKTEQPTHLSTQSFESEYFDPDRTIIVAVGEPKEVFKIRHWQITPTFQGLSEEEFISVFPMGRFRFEEYISAFGWKED